MTNTEKIELEQQSLEKVIKKLEELKGQEDSFIYSAMLSIKKRNEALLKLYNKQRLY